MSFQVFNDQETDNINSTSTSGSIVTNKLILKTDQSQVNNIPLLVGYADTNDGSANFQIDFDIVTNTKKTCSLGWGTTPRIRSSGGGNIGIGVESSTINSKNVQFGIVPNSVLANSAYYVFTSDLLATTYPKSFYPIYLYGSGQMSINDGSASGSTTIPSSVLLKVASIKKGFSPPIMSGDYALAINPPVEGMIVYANAPSTDGPITINVKGWWGYNADTGTNKGWVNLAL